MKKLLIIFLLVTSVSCDCIQEASGTIVDAKTGLPLEGVSYKGNWEIRTTGSTGNFFYHGISGGLFGCPPVTFIFEKEGYKKKKVVVSNHAEKKVKLYPKK
jgi:hypothetical protein